MKLIIDLGGSADAPSATGAGTIVLKGLLTERRSPVELVRTLWGRRYDEVRLISDPRHPALVDGGARVLTGLTRAERRLIVVGDSIEEVSRPAVLGGGLRAFLGGLRVEVTTLVRTRLRARRWAMRDPGLPEHAARTDSAVYIRADPSLHWMGAYVGGAATHTTGVINGLVADGVRTTVFSAEPPEGIPDGICVRVEPPPDLRLIGWAEVPRYGEALAERAAAEDADFVYQRYALGSYAGLEAAKRLGVPLVLEFNGSEVWVGQNWREGKAKKMSERLAAIERRNVVSASLVVVPSQVVADGIEEWGVRPERILVNPNGVDTGRLASFRAEGPEHWRRRCGLEEAPTIAFIGTFGPWHGATVIPRIAAAVAAAGSEARWVLVGDGVLRGAVEAEVAELGLGDRITLTGLLPNAEALAHLAAAEICISPHVPNPDGSRFFGSPTKLFEYMGLGKAIVASDLEQIGEVIEDGRNGLLCEPGDPESAADRVTTLLGDPGLRERVGAEALSDAEGRYGWNAHVARILERLRG